MKIILTGATGMVGEGVLLTCLADEMVTEVLVLGRRKLDYQHEKLKQIIVPEFLNIADQHLTLEGYDACFYCAGISSVGLNEKEYTAITYDATLAMAKVLLVQNPTMVFNYVTGRSTNINGEAMWARVKGKTEIDLQQLGFKGQYNFRPALMLPFKEQKNVKYIYRVLAQILSYFMRKSTITLQQLGNSMLNVVEYGYAKNVLEVEDIKMMSVR
jgi:uncharacterized protein YbjT (DUF2867 family)